LPILTIPDEGQAEQENNTAVIEEEGYGKRLGYSSSPEVVLECIKMFLEDDRYRKKTEKLRKLAK
jgi:UDP-N-acetylglucosamine--N-acetylmuramyl-(pentapeptide) pyrophosphoryl-undecaprenol N-acetylglucosamine transferase